MSKVADEMEIPQSARDSWAEYASCVKIPPLIRLPMNNAYVSGYIAGMKLMREQIKEDLEKQGIAMIKWNFHD